MYPHMDGKRVFLHAVRGMVMSTQAALAKTGLGWDDIQWFVPHQANLRINERVGEGAKIPHEKGLNTIEFYGNTTAATVPLTIDRAQQGKVKRGDGPVCGVRLRLHGGPAIFPFDRPTSPSYWGRLTPAGAVGRLHLTPSTTVVL